MKTILTDEEIKVAIAQATGWIGVRRDARGILVGVHREVWTSAPTRIPDWTGNLSDLHNLEEMLEREDMEEPYLRSLAKVLGVYDPQCTQGQLALLRATTRQRAEAALAVITSASASC